MNLIYRYLIVVLIAMPLFKAKAQCDLPQPFTGNTGINMTVFLPPDVISAFPLSSDLPYVVAISPDGLVVGSASVASGDLINGQQSLGVWGDDVATPELDGASPGDVITFQLVDGDLLYDLNLTFAGVNSFVGNGILPAIAGTAELNCSDSDSGSVSSCELPQPFSGNTGSNMTVFFTSGAIDALPISSDAPYIVAFSSDGLVVGSASVALTDLIGGQQSLAVWGDDTDTPEIDGALAGQTITFQLVDGNSLYDLNLSFAGVNSYVSNGQLPVLGSSSELVCSGSDASPPIPLCDLPLPQPFIGGGGVNMSLLFTSDAYTSLPISNPNAYIIALTSDNLIVGGTADIYDSPNNGFSISIFPNDDFTPEVTGAIDGEIIFFQLVDGSKLYNLDFNLEFLTNAFEVISSSINSELICETNVTPILGCTDLSACNYDSGSNSDDGSCEYPEEYYDCNGNCLNDADGDGVCDELEIVGCQEPSADNYDADATDEGDCEYLGCTDVSACNMIH